MFTLAQRVILADRWPRRLIALLGGACGALALAPFGFFPAFAIPMTLAVWLIDGSGAKTRWASLSRAAGAGWWMGFGYFVASLWWLGAAFLVEADKFAWALPLGVLGLPALLATFTAFGFVVARSLWSAGAARLCALALGLSVAEWLRGHVLTGFPWNDFGMALGGNLVLAQVASICGLYGLTMLSTLLFATPALLGGVRPQRTIPLLAALSLGLLAVFGLWRLQIEPGDVKGVRLRIVQPNIPLDQFRFENKEQLLERYLTLSDRSTSPQTTGIADVTHLFWPESAFPFILARDGGALSQLGARLQKTILFTGAARVEGSGRAARYFNAIQVVAKGEVKESYDKMHLAPFGEYMPFSGLLARLGITQFVDIPGGFEAGDSSRLLTSPGLPPIYPMICYESIFPDDVADNLRGQASRPGLMLNVTNDGWFGKTPGPYQHLAQARLRAIETGLPIIRAANTGVSAIIDPLGRIVASAPLGVDGVVDGPLPRALEATPFLRHPKSAPLILGFFSWQAPLFGAAPFDFRSSSAANRHMNVQPGPSVTKVPNPIDRHVGARVRMRRMLLGMSQEKLGEALGLTFQQVQKYEKGTNRISASRLQQISETLNIPLAFFFAGAPVSDGAPNAGFAEATSEDAFATDFVMTAEGLSLNRAFAKISDAKVRKKIVDLVATIAESETSA